MFVIGDIVEPQDPRTKLPAGHYEVIRFGPRAVKLWRLSMGGHAASATVLERTVILPIAMLDGFQFVSVAGEEAW